MNIEGYEFTNPFAEKFFGKGKAEGKAEALLRILERRGLVLTSEDRATITGCHDMAVLNAWLDAALDARSVAEVFAAREA